MTLFHTNYQRVMYHFRKNHTFLYF
jgi:hypothetical protein